MTQRKAHLCNPPSCARITLREKCDRCASTEWLARILAKAAHPRPSDRIGTEQA